VGLKARESLMAHDWSNLAELMPAMRMPRAFLPQPDETAAELAAAPAGGTTARSRSDPADPQ
jgi:hypothetical protein